jgi:hypothetical protein
MRQPAFYLGFYFPGREIARNVKGGCAMKSFSVAAAVVLLSLIACGAEASTLYSWNASSGLYPDLASPDCTLVVSPPGSNVSQDLSDGVLTLENDQIPRIHTYDYYAVSNTEIGGGTAFMIDATMQLVSETNQTDARDAAGMDIEFPAPGGGLAQSLEIGPNRIFMLHPDTDHRGATASVVTTDAMHHYHIDVSASGVASAFFDGVLEVSEPLVYDTGVTWPHMVAFGNNTNQVSGVSQW